MSDLISRQAAIDALYHVDEYNGRSIEAIRNLPSAQPERLTDDDFETIRIHLNAYKEKLCNQQRWEEADEYQRIIDRFMAFASAQPEPQWIPCSERLPEKPFGCLVTVWDTDPITMDEFENILPYFVGWDGEQWNDADGEQCPLEVIAWMPLPLPYQGERREE